MDDREVWSRMGERKEERKRGQEAFRHHREGRDIKCGSPGGRRCWRRSRTRWSRRVDRPFRCRTGLPRLRGSSFTDRRHFHRCRQCTERSPPRGAPGGASGKGLRLPNGAHSPHSSRAILSQAHLPAPPKPASPGQRGSLVPLHCPTPSPGSYPTAADLTQSPCPHLLWDAPTPAPPPTPPESHGTW